MNLEPLNDARERAQQRANATQQPVEIRVRHTKAVKEGRQTKTPSADGERKLKGNYNRDRELVVTERAEPLYILTKAGEKSSASLVETVQPAKTKVA